MQLITFMEYEHSHISSISLCKNLNIMIKVEYISLLVLNLVLAIFIGNTWLAILLNAPIIIYHFKRFELNIIMHCFVDILKKHMNWMPQNYTKKLKEEREKLFLRLCTTSSFSDFICSGLSFFCFLFGFLLNNLIALSNL